MSELEPLSGPMEILDQPPQSLIPPRTVLAPLEPIGLGTPHVESLSSYFQRLADHHKVSPKALARAYVLEKLGYRKQVGEEQADRFWRTSFFNGMGEVPEAWCHILEELTGVSGLRRLTLLPLRGRIGLKGCASSTRRWCPHCLHEAEADGEPYGQLLWEIGWVKACPKHGVPLEFSHGCSHEDAIRPLQVTRLPHVCESCARSLCRPFKEGITTAATDTVMFAKSVGELLAGPVFTAKAIPLERGVAEFLKDVLITHEGGKGMRVVRRLGLCKSDISGWLRRKHLPSLPHALRIAETYGASLSNVLLGEGGTLSVSLNYPLDAQPISSRFHRVPTPVSNMEGRLKQFLEQPIPPSVVEAASVLGTSSRDLRSHFPGLTHSLAEKHAQRKSQDASLRRLERMQVVQAIVAQLVSAGVVPTIRRIEERLIWIPKSFLFQERCACKQLCELGKEKLGMVRLHEP